jgi:hypothetical protein
LVRKADNTLRFCIDFRRVNDLVVYDSWPLRRVADILDALRAPRYFSTLDLKAAFWTVPLSERSKEITAFRTPAGHFEFQVLPFGLKTAPSAFQRCIDQVLSGLSSATPYLDDVIVFSHTWQEHLDHLRRVFRRLRYYGLQLNSAKCNFAAPQLRYLGFIISHQGVAVESDKIDAIRRFPTPANLGQLRSFLGVCAFVRRYIQDFALRARPLYRLLKKDQPWLWDEDAQRAFEDLKKATEETVILAHPDWDAAPFVLDVDSSRLGVGSVLCQSGRPIAFWSKAFSTTQAKYSAQELELLGVLVAVLHFRPYCFGRRFILRCDHKNLKSIMFTESRTGRVERWSEALSAFDFDLQYRPGDKMAHVDALSRNPQPLSSAADTHEPDSTAPALATTRARARATVEVDRERSQQQEQPPEQRAQPSPPLVPREQGADDEGLSAVRASQDEDPFTQSLITGVIPTEPDLRQAVCSALNQNTFKVIQGVLYKKDGERQLLVIPKQLRHQVLHAAHSLSHRGRRKILAVLRLRVWWPAMGRDVSCWTRCCDVCQRNVPLPRHGHLGHVVPANTLPFRRICADVTGPLSAKPTEQGHTHLLVIMCMASRWVEAFPLRSSGDHIEISRHLLTWITHYGVPQQVHSDQGSPFMAQALLDAYNQLGIKRTRTTPYHPAGDPAERAIGSVKRVMRALCAESPGDWDLALPAALMALRAQLVATTGLAPYEAVFGAPMRVPFDETFATEPVAHPTPLHGLPQRLQRLRQRLVASLERERARYKAQYDKKRKDVDFNIGDKVLLHFPRGHTEDPENKLSLPWRGPYNVVRRAPKSNIYEIADNNNREIQMVHAQRLVKYFSLPPHLLPQPTQKMQPDARPDPPAQSDASSASSSAHGQAPDKPAWEVECLCGRRKRAGVTYYLVQWAGVDPANNQPYAPTWEPAALISQDLIDEFERLHRGFRR